MVVNSGRDQLWACAGYLKTKQTVHYPTLFSNMKASIINEAKNVESNNTANRPSRRATDNDIGILQDITKCNEVHSCPRRHRQQFG